jgi:hypothetical protein
MRWIERKTSQQPSTTRPRFSSNQRRQRRHHLLHAVQLALSVAMVKKHLYAMFRKLEVTSRSRLMALMR